MPRTTRSTIQNVGFLFDGLPNRRAAPRPKPVNHPAQPEMFTNVVSFKQKINSKTALKYCRHAISPVYLSSHIFIERHNRHPFSRFAAEEGGALERRFWVVDGGMAAGVVLHIPGKSGEKIFFLSIICSNKRRGTQLFNAVKAEAQKLNCNKIWLSSVPDKTGLYKRWGFEFGPGRNTLNNKYKDIMSLLKEMHREPGTKNNEFKRNQNGGYIYNTLGERVPHPRPTLFYKIPKLGNHKNGLRNGILMSMLLQKNAAISSVKNAAGSSSAAKNAAGSSSAAKNAARSGVVKNAENAKRFVANTKPGVRAAKTGQQNSVNARQQFHARLAEKAASQQNQTVSRTGTVLNPIQILQQLRSNQTKKRKRGSNTRSVKPTQNVVNLTGNSNGNNSVINITGNSNGNNNVINNRSNQTIKKRKGN